MKVITVGTDRKILENGSAVQKRQIEYGSLFDELHIVIFTTKSADLNPKIKISENVWVYPTNSKNKIFYIIDAFSVVKSITRDSYSKIKDFVFSTQDPFETGVVCLLVKLFYGLPLQVQLHTDFNNKYFVLHSPLNFIRFLIAHLVIPFADSVRCVSLRAANSIKDLNTNISVLPISQDLDLESLDFKRDFKGRLLTVCRLEKEKNIKNAINIFAKISTKYKEAVFTIVGDGSQRKGLELIARNLGIGDRVKFVGWQNNLKDFYIDSDIYISTSVFEGYGMAVVEAALYGLPLVLSDAGIAKEYFKDKGAFVCDPMDTDCFYKSLETLFEKEEVRNKMGIEAKMSAKSNLISWSDYLIQYKRLIDGSLVEVPGSLFTRLISFLSLVINRNKLLRFIIAGGTAAFVQIGSLYVFTDVFKIWYLYSSILSFCVAIVVSFFLQKTWAFQDRNLNGVHIQFIKYVFVILIAAVINTALMYIWVDILNVWYILAQIFTGVVIAVFNFLAYRRFVFNK